MVRFPPDFAGSFSANVLIREYGEDAPIHAAMRADEMLDKGDLDGLAVWKRVVAAVKELLANEPPSGAGVH